MSHSSGQNRGSQGGTWRVLVVAVAAVRARARAAAGSAAAAALLVEAVEQPARRPRAGLRDAAEDADERVFRAAPRVLVGLGRVARLVAHRRVPVGVATGVVAAEDPLVVTVGGPVVKLGEPDDGERVGVALQLQQL